MKVVYSPGYDITLLGLERLHPFDSTKYSRAWKAVHHQVESLPDRTIEPGAPVTDDELALVHEPGYLKSLGRADVLAQALEMAPLAFVPAPLTAARLLTPMRRAVRGTLRAAEAALDGGLAMNLAGGYHHACPDHGEGFCVFNDIAWALAQLRASGRLTETDRVLYIDLDAHQGNGVARCLLDDRRVTIVDAYNRAIYPDDRIARARIDIDLALRPHIDDADYLDAVREGVGLALESGGAYALAIYNAGTDVHHTDPLGALGLTDDGVFARDRFVVEALRARTIPTFLLTSGGYSAVSYRLIARTLTWLLTDA